MVHSLSDKLPNTAKGRVTRLALLGCILIALGNAGFFLAAIFGFFRFVFSRRLL